MSINDYHALVKNESVSIAPECWVLPAALVDATAPYARGFAQHARHQQLRLNDPAIGQACDPSRRAVEMMG